jgi:hypothetical protein
MRESIRRVFNEIRENVNGPRMERRTVIVLLSTPILLTLYYYFGRPSYFRREHMDWAGETFGETWEYLGLVPYGYWAIISMVIRVGLPLLLIYFVLRQNPKAYGFTLKGSLTHAHIYLLIVVAMVPIVYLAGTQDNFQAKYPFYNQAHLGGWHFWAYEGFYLLQFFALEAFFRGFIVFGLYPRFGYYSVLIQIIPYCMIHFNKPFAETMAAIVAGTVLGVLALRSGTFYIGVLVHFAVALGMDLIAVSS